MLINKNMLIKAIIILITISSCANKNHIIDINLKKSNIDIAEINNNLTLLEQVDIIKDDTCMLLKNPKRKVICLYEDEWKKNELNYLHFESNISKLFNTINFYENIR